MSSNGRIERVDAIVVGARCAGSAVASVLARAARQVLVLDRTAFPSDTLSTHVLLPDGVSNMARDASPPLVLPPRANGSVVLVVPFGSHAYAVTWQISPLAGLRR